MDQFELPIGSRVVYLLLLEPTQKIFEVIKVEYGADSATTTTTVGDLLDMIGARASEPALVAQRHVGLCRTWDDGVEMKRNEYAYTAESGAAPMIRDGEVLIAIPAGWSAEKCRERVGKILRRNPKLVRLLGRSDPMEPPRRSSNKRRKRPRKNDSMRMIQPIAEDEGEGGSENIDFLDDAGMTDARDNTTGEVKRILSERTEGEDHARKEVEEMVRRQELARKNLEDRVRREAEVKARARMDIEERARREAEDTQTLGHIEPIEKDCLNPAELIELLALEASEQENRRVSRNSAIGMSESFLPLPNGDPVAPSAGASADSDDGASVSPDPLTVANATRFAVKAMRSRAKSAKRRLRRLRIAATKKTRQIFTTRKNDPMAHALSAVFVAISSVVLYRIFREVGLDSKSEQAVTSTSLGGLSSFHVLSLPVMVSIVVLLVKLLTHSKGTSSSFRRSTMSPAPRRKARMVRGADIRTVTVESLGNKTPQKSAY